MIRRVNSPADQVPANARSYYGSTQAGLFDYRLCGNDSFDRKQYQKYLNSAHCTPSALLTYGEYQACMAQARRCV